MHLLVPFASDLSEACQHVLADLALPHLERLLALAAPAGRDEGDEFRFSPPHERALAAARGWHGDDGALPFAAHAARADGVLPAPQNGGDVAWALLSPAHWQLGRDHVTLLDPDVLALDDGASKALFASLSELLEGDGFVTAWGAADRWYAGRADLDGLATASLDRVIGRSVDLWLRPPAGGEGGAQAAARRVVRRVQSEAQLLFHTHPVNDAREEGGALAVNSFWLSGCGRPQPADAAATPEIDGTLRAALLAGDWAAWADAWRALDAGALTRLLQAAEQGGAVTLTLCGERAAARFESRGAGVLRRLAARWRRSEPRHVLAAL